MFRLQVGIIAYKDSQTGKYRHSEPLKVFETQDLLESEKELRKSVIEFYKSEIKKNINKQEFKK